MLESDAAPGDLLAVLDERGVPGKQLHITGARRHEAGRAAGRGDLGRAFENESVRTRGLRQAIQQTLSAETSERELVLDAEFAATFDEACLDGRHDVLGTLALHRTTVSR